MILILTDRNDSHSNCLIPKIVEEKLPYFRFDLDVKSLMNTKVTYKNRKWYIIQNYNKLDLSNVKCIWNRRTFVELLLEEENNHSADFRIWKNEWNKTLVGIYTNLEPHLWLNYWRNSYKAENKYLQMDVAFKRQLLLPDTIVSNDKKELLKFANRYGNVALKFMQQDFYKSVEGKYEGLYVNKINAKSLNKFKEREENPITLQKYMNKNFEVRYTVVGKKHFVCKIDSQKNITTTVDWRRYNIPKTPHSVITAPKEIRMKVNKLMKDLNLEYGALDFIVTKNNDWFFLEVNPMGQYLWIEDLTGLKISEAIIKWFKNKLS